MKKNRFLKTAGCLLILCLLTTCVIGTTFAKYTTSGSTTDSARVAHWGVTLNLAANDGIFSNEYDVSGTGASVKSTTNVVAPGTSTDATTATAARFSLAGQPEVAVNVKIDLAIANDIVLKAGTYKDETTADNLTDEFTLAEDYYPVVFTLWQISGVDDVPYTPARKLATGNLAAIQTFLNTYNSTANYEPNTKLNSVYELTWKWAIDGNDKADTYLGNRIAFGETGAAYNLEIGYTITITVTQID